MGVLSLAHPAFFGIGAYTAAILAVNYNAPPLLCFFLGAILAGLLSFGIGIPSFRLSQHSFAIGTLGFALIVELVSRNWIGLTRGPMGIPGIPRPVLSIPYLFQWSVSRLTDFYYFMCILVVLGVAFYIILTRSRVGRAFLAIREDEVLAASAGIYPLKYKMIAFIVRGLHGRGGLESFMPTGIPSSLQSNSASITRSTFSSSSTWEGEEVCGGF